jgi:hypothetical protein
MNSTLIFNQITTLLSIIGAGSIIALLLGRWLARPRPRITLIQVEPGTGTMRLSKAAIGEERGPKAVIGKELGTETRWGSKASTVGVSSDIVQLSVQFRLANKGLDAEADPIGLYNFFLIAKSGSQDLQKALHKTKALLEDLNGNHSNINRMRIMMRLLDDDLLSFFLMTSIETNELILTEPKLPPMGEDMNEERFHLEVERWDHRDGINEYMIVVYPSPVYRKQIVSLRGPLLDVEAKRCESLAKMIECGDCEGLTASLNFIINRLREQHEIADQLVDSIQPLIQSISWQVEVVAYNKGDRAVLLSPYAVLITKGHQELPYLPLTALEESKDAKSKEKKDNSQRGELDENSFARYIVLEPQKVTQITFLADIPDNEEKNYSQLGQAYSARILDCSIIVKREDIRNWRGGPITLRSPWTSFGERIAEDRRKEIVALADRATLRQEGIAGFTRVRQDS